MISSIIKWFTPNPPKRNVKNKYLKGVRRLAKEGQEIEPDNCWTCKHQVAYVTWHCDRHSEGKDCKWAKCYSRDEITKADYWYNSDLGVSKWVGLPSE